jgi:hypothetical protein
VSNRPDLLDLFGMIALALAIIVLAYIFQNGWIIRGGDMIGPI